MVGSADTRSSGARWWGWTRRVLLGLLTVAGLIALVGGAWLGTILRTRPPGVYASGPKAWDPLPAPPDGNTKPVETLYFTSLRPANWDVYLFEPTGSGPLGEPVRLTEHPGLDYNATMSPDGRWVVFTSERRGSADLWALDLNATDGAPGAGPSPVLLTAHPATDDAADFSPDGRRIAFVSTRTGDPEIFTMPFRPEDPAAAEAEAVNITNHPAGDFNPAFSPDGDRIAFSSSRWSLARWNPARLFDPVGFLHTIYTVRSNGTDVRRVAKRFGVIGAPAWSPDGSRIVAHDRDGPDVRIVSRSVNGGGAEEVSPGDLDAFSPATSPDGGIVFVAKRPDEDSERTPFRRLTGGALHRVDGDGSNPQRLTSSDLGFQQPHVHTSGRILAHGDGPLDELVLMPNQIPVAWPDSMWFVELPDRILRIQPLRAYFPAYSPGVDRVFALPWLHEDHGWPPGPAPLLAIAPDGSRWERALESADDGFIWGPAASRDGEWIVYAKGSRTNSMPGQNVDVWMARTDGSQRVNLTRDSSSNDAFPDISADGSRIVFRGGEKEGVASEARPSSGWRRWLGGWGDPERNFEIYILHRGSDELRRLTHTPGVETMPTISPDGRWVVFATDRLGKGLKLWIQSVDDPGDEGRPLEPDRSEVFGFDVHPRFSPDGRWVVFASDRGGLHDEHLMSGFFPQPYGDLWVVPVDGSQGAVRLTHDKWEDGPSTWAPAPSAP